MLIEEQSDIEVIAEAEDGRNTVRLVRELSPDVVIMDIAMQNLNGVEATRQIITHSPGTKIIGLSMHSESRFIIEMLKVGATGYLLKDCDPMELIDAIRIVMSNQIYLQPSITNVIVKDHIQQQLPKANSTSYTILTTREREVLQLLTEGKNTKQAALCLNVSIKTIGTHRRNIMQKLEIFNLADLIKYAIHEGITSP
jgi:DNA-binding NarL/FixJ family response regulator